MRVWKLRPTLRGILTLGTFVFVVVTAIVTGTPELAPLAVVIGVPLAVSPLLAYRRAGRANASLVLHAHVEPGAVEAGTTSQVKLSITNRATAGAATSSIGLPSVEDEWRANETDPVPDTRIRWVAPSLSSLQVLAYPAPGRTESCLLPVPTGRRGVFTLRPQQCWAHDPFGLVGAPGPVTPIVVAVVHAVPLQLNHPAVGTAASVVGSTSTLDSGSARGWVNSRDSVPTWPVTGSAFCTGRPRSATGRGSSVSSPVKAPPRCPSFLTIGRGYIGASSSNDWCPPPSGACSRRPDRPERCI